MESELKEQAAEGEGTKPNIANELQDLGRNLTAATKAVLESPEAREFGSQLQRGLTALDKSVHQLVDQARETPVGQKVEGGVSEATGAVKERHILETLAESVATALHTVNLALGQAVEKAQARAQEEKSAPQQIEVVDDEETEILTEDEAE